jgi:hypothetical protein
MQSIVYKLPVPEENEATDPAKIVKWAKDTLNLRRAVPRLFKGYNSPPQGAVHVGPGALRYLPSMKVPPLPRPATFTEPAVVGPCLPVAVILFVETVTTFKLEYS